MVTPWGHELGTTRFRECQTHIKRPPFSVFRRLDPEPIHLDAELFSGKSTRGTQGVFVLGVFPGPRAGGNVGRMTSP